MADNTVLNSGSGGDVIATEDNAGVKTELVKTVWGPTGTINKVDNAAGKRFPVNLAESALLPAALGPNGGLKVEEVGLRFSSLVLQGSQVAANTNGTTTRTVTTAVGGATSANILINITAGGTATGTLQLFVQDSYDGGTTWNDVIASNPITFGAAGVTQVFSIDTFIASSQVQGSAQQLETMAAGTARMGPFGDRFRVREKVSGVSGSPVGPTYVISGVFK